MQVTLSDAGAENWAEWIYSCCVISWGDSNKHLFTTKKAPMTDRRNDPTQVSLWGHAQEKGCPRFILFSTEAFLPVSEEWHSGRMLRRAF